MKYRLMLFGLCLSALVYGQDFNVSTVVPLDGAVFETSGLIWLENRLITHNDSGDGPYLYEIDTVDGEVMRTVVVANAGSQDWEDICHDGEYIYIGDFGNNSGTRTNLRIFKVSVSDYLTTPNDTVYCDTISFNYSDQTDFEPATYTTNYDAESLIALTDSLYIFTKNWGNNETNVYSISKEPGTYSISIIDNLDPEGLITGADYDAEKNELILTGHTLFTPFLYFVKGFSGNAFSSGTAIRATPAFEGSIQIEGTASLGDHSFFVSSENMDGAASILHRLDISGFIDIPIVCLFPMEIVCYPNPASNRLSIGGTEFKEALIFNASGQLVLATNKHQIDVSGLTAGMYVLQLKDENDTVFYIEKVTVE